MGTPIAVAMTSGGGRLCLHKGDITLETVDVIVNAANSGLAHGGGVAGAIVRRGGEEIQEECLNFIRRYGPVPVGKAVWSGPGRLPLKGIIHAVGPMWGEGDEERKLREAALSALQLAAQREMHTLAMPAISSGIFGFPRNLCAEILVAVSLEFLEDHPVESLQEVRFALIDDETVDIFRDEFLRRFGSESLIHPGSVP
jgi:O-acetyl-ADP-ribose deacetylase (regulator of RNase III)